MTPPDRERLRALCAAATPGPWQTAAVNEFEVAVAIVSHYEVAPESINLAPPECDAAYIAAASPDAVLALLDALDAVKRERDEARAQRDQTAREFDKAWGAAVKANTERDAFAALLAECREQFIEGDPAWCDTSPLFARIDAALDGAKGNER